MIVAIDGPAGAGKSTVARILAEELGFAYVNTGSMYRAIALAALREGVNPDDPGHVAKLAEAHRVRLEAGERGERVFLDDEEVTAEVRDGAVSAIVSRVAAHAALRATVVYWQREMMQAGDWVADGRDIGSVVAPDAEVKVFLTADSAERARRRHAELAAAGDTVAFDEVHADLRERDARDESRATSPLIVAEGATVVDTTGRTIDEVVQVIGVLAREARSA